jgi:transposase
MDWADQRHAYHVRTRDGKSSSGSVRGAPEEFHAWIRSLRVEFPEGNIVVAIEEGRRGVLDALVSHPYLTILPINPRASRAYRESRRLSGSSSDPVDAELICEFAFKHLDELHVWRPNDEITRKLRALVETRRQLVDQRTAHMQQLSATLKDYFPQVIDWFNGVTPNVLWAILRLWPTLAALQGAPTENLTRLMKAHRLHRVAQRVEHLTAKMLSAVHLIEDPVIVETGAMKAKALAVILDALDAQIVQFDTAIEQAWSTHPDAEIFNSLPGAGPVMAPRLAAAFGMDRGRYRTASELQCYTGIAPVTEASGKRKTVHARWQHPKFIHQTFHEFAQNSLPHTPWAKASYRQQRQRGVGHHAAIRTVAFQWMRILFRLWTDHVPYDDAIYMAALRRRGSPLAQTLAA